jgi:hypothetical protein
MRIAHVEIKGTNQSVSCGVSYDLDNLNTSDVLVGSYVFQAFEVPNMGAHGIHDKEFGFIARDTLSQATSKEKVVVPSQVQNISVILDMLQGRASNVSFGNGGNGTSTGSPINDLVEASAEFNKRLYMMEELNDLVMSDSISKEEYIKIRKLYRSTNEEDRVLARTLVSKQHEKFIGF